MGQLTSVMLCSLFWISWPLKMGLIGCPEMCREFPVHTVQYLTRMQLSHDDLVMQALVWLQMVWFRAIRFGMVQFGASYTNSRWPHKIKCQI